MLGDKGYGSIEVDGVNVTANTTPDSVGGRKQRIMTTELPEGKSYNLCFMV